VSSVVSKVLDVARDEGWVGHDLGSPIGEGRALRLQLAELCVLGRAPRAFEPGTVTSAAMTASICCRWRALCASIALNREPDVSSSSR
jgi:hypothetical protein